MRIRRRALLTTIAAPAVRPLLAAQPDGDWLGPEFWANPMQDWRVRGGRIENHVAGGDRNVYWLTRSLGESGDFEMSVRLGPLGDVKGPGWAGFRVGVKTWFGHYKDAAVRGVGLECGLTHEGRLFIGDPSQPGASTTGETSLTLRLAGNRLTLTAGGASVEREVTADLRPWLAGGVALVASNGPLSATPKPLTEPTHPTAPKPNTNRGGGLRYFFEDWKLSGPRVRQHPERAFGPILFNQYTLSGGVLKMTVQLAPVTGEAELQVRGRTVARAAIDADSATARFRVEKWNEREAAPYTVVYGGSTLKGTIARNPEDKPRLVVGSLTCQNDFGYPHEEILRNLEHVRPDILFFTGDQVYERNGEYGIQRGPAEAARLDYLRKWYLFGWSWGALTKDIPCVCLPDDHDVYHGNIWGASGRRAEIVGPRNADWQDTGGFTMPATWVNLVQRTQSSHLPDGPAARTEQNITTHFTSLDWGGVSFAILEDRKFKSAPKALLPEARIYNGWPQNPAWNSAGQGDVAGASLLGEDQEKFLEEWARRWPEGVWTKAVVSATIFCNLATLPGDAMSDAVVPGLATPKVGEYVSGDKTVADHDSNGWPQTPRNRALRLIRACQAVHLAGDQHLASTVQYGIDAHDDGPWAICSPAIANLFPRRWFPPVEGANRKPGSPRYTGQHRDGFGNRITVHAVANPAQFGIAPAAQNNRAPGFGIVVFERAPRRITMTNWPRWADLRRKDQNPYPGWPVTIAPEDNGLAGARFKLRLPRAVSGVVEVTESGSGRLVLSLRLAKPAAELRVWDEGEYDVKAGGLRLERLRAAPA